VQDVPGDLFVMFSTAPGDVADDGKGSRNSPFAEAFLKYIYSPEPLKMMTTDVINETMMLTNNSQRPFSRGSIISDKHYSLNPDGAVVAYTSEDQARYFYEEGIARFTAREWDAAIFYFTEAIRLDIKISDTYLYRAIANEEKGNTDRAIADYSEAINKDRASKRNPVPHVKRGMLYIQKTNYARAKTDFDMAIFLDPGNAGVYNLRGVMYFRQGDYDLAIADFTEALRIDPNFEVAKDNLEAANRRGE
jgi:tetratricopeptide (TPR) repeat protein